MGEPASAAPRASLTMTDVAIMVVGIVLGIGIFKTPSLVANFSNHEAMFLGLWALGGLITLVGAVCYAELGSARPNAGGEYSFLHEAYGPQVALLFAWARCSVIQPGAIAAVAFVMGDYANVVLPLGAYGHGIYAIASIIIFTGINYMGRTPGTLTQKLFEAATVLSLVGIIISAFVMAAPTPPVGEPRDVSLGLAGLAMVFVLLTYGGWNEAAYLSGELQNAKRNMAKALVIGVLIVIALYLAINYAYLHVLGLDAIRKSNAVAADMMQIVAGPIGATIVSIVVVLSALTTLNGTIITGSRSYYALGRDLAALRHIGTWEERGETPANALLLQGALSVALVIFGAATRGGFEAMVAYTAPVFWLFMMLVALSIYVFRSRETGEVTHYRVPLYPVTPAILALTCLWMLYSSLAYAGWGSIIGAAILLLGLPLLLLKRTAEAKS
jgi:APA family basic amino acid/polyamine antiporter